MRFDQIKIGEYLYAYNRRAVLIKTSSDCAEVYLSLSWSWKVGQSFVFSGFVNREVLTLDEINTLKAKLL